jgi:hypothetical protein
LPAISCDVIPPFPSFCHGAAVTRLHALGSNVTRLSCLPASNTGFPNGDYPPRGRSTWRWLRAARLGTLGKGSSAPSGMVCDRRPFSTLWAREICHAPTLPSHVMSSTLDVNHLPVSDPPSIAAGLRSFAMVPAPPFPSLGAARYGIAGALCLAMAPRLDCRDVFFVPRIRLVLEKCHLTASRQEAEGQCISTADTTPLGRCMGDRGRG